VNHRLLFLEGVKIKENAFGRIGAVSEIAFFVLN
jgi:hypothetical protein